MHSDSPLLLPWPTLRVILSAAIDRRGRVGGELTPELLRCAVVEREPAAVGASVRLLTPIVRTAVVRVLVRRRAGAGGRDVRQEVDDLLQEVFSALLADGGRRLLAWSPERGSAATFFGVVAQRLVSNVLDSRRRSPWTEQPTEAAVLERHVTDGAALERRLDARRELRQLGERLQEGLNERDQRLFHLLYVEQCEPAEVCGELGLSANALSQARRRLGQRLRRLVEALAEPGVQEAS